jgi:hypothetical protein
MERKQKKFLGQINPKSQYKGWDPFGDAKRCMASMKIAADMCDPDKVIAGAACAHGNAEAAFYEKQASEDEMNSIKEAVERSRLEFRKNCACTSR